MSGARRYGGAHSPGGAPGGPSPRGLAAAPRRLFSFRALGLYLAPTPLAFAALFSVIWLHASGFVALAGAYALLLVGAEFTRQGVAAARSYEAHAVAKPPAFPRKLFAAALTGAGVGLAALNGWIGGVASAVVFGSAAALLHVLTFGPDPLRAKGIAGLEGEALDDAVAKIENGRRLIAEMRAAVDPLRDPELRARVGRLAGEAEALLDEVARDPTDVRRARRLLSVYLVGARDAAVKYAQTVERGRDEEARAAYLALLDDLEGHVARSRKALTADERTALDVEIEVLRDRLKMEGV